MQTSEKSLTRQIQIRNRIGSNSLETRKKLNVNLISNAKNYKESDKKEHKNVSFKKDRNNYNNMNKPIDLTNPNKSYDKISIQNTNINKDLNNNGYLNKSKNIKNILLNSVKGSQSIKKGSNNIIQLPSVSSSNVIFTPTKQKESLSKESNNIKSVVTDSNVIVLPEIKNLKSSVDNKNKDDTAVENKRYLLLFQKNNNKEFTSKKAIKFNNNVIILSEEKEKTKNKGIAKSLNEPKKTKKDNIFNKRTKI